MEVKRHTAGRQVFSPEVRLSLCLSVRLPLSLSLTPPSAPITLPHYSVTDN